MDIAHSIPLLRKKIRYRAFNIYLLYLLLADIRSCIFSLFAHVTHLPEMKYIQQQQQFTSLNGDSYKNGQSKTCRH